MALNALSLGNYRPTGGGGYHPSAESYFERLPDSISTEKKAFINSFISGFLEDNAADFLYNIFDYFYLFGGVDTQANANINLVSSSFPITPVNVPTWDNQGYTGNGSTSYLKNAFVDSNDAVITTMNDCFLGVFCRTNGTSTASIELGNFSDLFAYNSSYVATAYTLSEFRITVNDTPNPFLTYANTDGRGLFVSYRLLNDRYGYINGSQVLTDSSTPSGLPEYENYILCSNYLNDIPLRFSNKQVVVAFKGKGSLVDQAAFYTRLNTLMTNLGCNI